jgi:hypothetical protein
MSPREIEPGMEAIAVVNDRPPTHCETDHAGQDIDVSG